MIDVAGVAGVGLRLIFVKLKQTGTFQRSKRVSGTNRVPGEVEGREREFKYGGLAFVQAAFVYCLQRKVPTC
jgi:hypothetical protein